MNIASILLDVSIPGTLDYEIPKEFEGAIVFGSYVEVPLRGKTCRGWVVELKDSSDFQKLKSIKSICSNEPGLTQEVFALAKWVASYYVTPLPKVLKAIIPSSLRKITKHKTVSFVQRAQTKEQIREYVSTINARSESAARVLEILLTVEKEIILTELCEKARATKGPIETLAKKGLLKIVTREWDRTSLNEEEFFQTKPKILNPQQKETLEKIVKGLSHHFETHLVFGVTGSGKTEVYLQAVDQALKKGAGVLIMVPEIALTTQLIDRFKGRFKEKIAILHHRLSDGERFDAWHKLRRGEIKMALGARSAVFAPVHNLKLIIVDEEHEGSYKQTDEMPCYHARDVAVMRGKMENAVVVLGSATPSLESAYNAYQNKYTYSLMQDRHGASLPKIKIIDMKREYEKAKGYTIFSDELLSKIQERKERGEQSILFLNRRGFHTSVMCLSCGSSIQCKHCDQSMTFHKKETALSCHLCGFVLSPLPSQCPKCHQTTKLKFKGVGTEQVEKALKAIDPEIRVLRIDADTTKHKGSHERLFKEFATQKADVLIGTQMVAKGLHFPLVTLVGILNADQSLQFPDYKAQETTFQLITQVSGRAGRCFHNGEVIVQTSLMDHPLLKLASTQNYEEFYQQELSIRECFQFPPFNSMAKVRISGSDDKKTERIANSIRDDMLEALPKETVIFPVVPRGHFKVKDRYFYQFFLLTKNLNPFRQAYLKMNTPSSVRVHVDINPISTYF